MESCNETHQLIPEDVIFDILLRLPVKSLIRARAVCKNWYTIIKNPSFVAKHFNHYNNSGRLFVNRFDKISQKYIFSLFPDQTLAGSSPDYQDLVVDMPNRLWVHGCNGILCLSYLSKRFALWNPATREFKSLPVLPRNFPPNVMSYQETFGFGFDPTTNDYKVVWIWDTLDNFRKIRYGPYRVAVYTLSTDSWRHLDVALTHSWIDTNLNTCINGVYYWCATEGYDQFFILSFDMGNELFHEIRDIPSPKPEVLVPYNNSLALMYYDHSPRKLVNIWVMREEGGWTKQFTVQLLLEFRLPFGFWKNGQLIMEIGDSCVALYDPESREVKYLGYPVWSDCFVHRESLVTIRGGDGFLEEDRWSDVDQILNFSETDFSSS